MKRPRILAFTIICLASTFSLTALLAEENTQQNQNTQEKKILTQNTPGTPTSPGQETTTSQTAGAASDTQAAVDSFTIEKLIIGLGLAAAIVLCILKWGTGSKPNKQEK